MGDASVAVPRICLAQLFGTVELPEAIVDTRSISRGFGDGRCRAQSRFQDRTDSLVKWYVASQAGVKRPTLPSVELYNQLEFKVLRLGLLLLLCLTSFLFRLLRLAYGLFLRLIILLLFVVFSCCFISCLASELFCLINTLVKVVALSRDTCSFQHLSQSHLIVKSQRTASTLRPVTVDANLLISILRRTSRPLYHVIIDHLRRRHRTTIRLLFRRPLPRHNSHRVR